MWLLPDYQCRWQPSSIHSQIENSGHALRHPTANVYTVRRTSETKRWTNPCPHRPHSTEPTTLHADLHRPRKLGRLNVWVSSRFSFPCRRYCHGCATMSSIHTIYWGHQEVASRASNTSNSKIGCEYKKRKKKKTNETAHSGHTGRKPKQKCANEKRQGDPWVKREREKER